MRSAPLAFQMNIDEQNGNPDFIIRKLLVTLNGITLFSDTRRGQPIPAEMGAAMIKLTQTSDLCPGAIFGSINENHIQHSLFHRDPAELDVAHWHLMACDLVTPKHLYDTLMQLVKLQNDKAFMQKLARSYVDKRLKDSFTYNITGKDLIPEFIPGVARDYFRTGFHANQKVIREDYANYKEIKSLLKETSNNNGKLKGVLLNCGVSFLMGFGIALLHEFLKKQHISKRSVDQTIDALILIYALTTGGTSLFLKIVMMKSLANIINIFGEHLPAIAKISLLLASCMAFDNSAWTAFKFFNFISNAASVNVGQLTGQITYHSVSSMWNAPEDELDERNPERPTEKI